MTRDRADQLQAAADDGELLAIVAELERDWDEDNVGQCDTAWDAIHRAVTDGRLSFGGGDYPLSHCVLGPRQLYRGDDRVVSLVLAHEVQDVARAIEPLDADWLRSRYDSLVPSDYSQDYGPEDRDYTAEWFESVRELFLAAASRDRAVIFTVID